jgi:hypothetical protein
MLHYLVHYIDKVYFLILDMYDLQYNKLQRVLLSNSSGQKDKKLLEVKMVTQ